MADFILELVVNIVVYLCYPIGWLFLRIVTFGNYPSQRSVQEQQRRLFFPSQNKWSEEDKITLVGSLVLLAAFVVFVFVKNAGGKLPG